MEEFLVLVWLFGYTPETVPISFIVCYILMNVLVLLFFIYILFYKCMSEELRNKLFKPFRQLKK